MFCNLIDNQRNGVNGCSIGAASPGRGSHAHQVTPDRQQVTECKRMSTLKVGTWNVRTMSGDGKFDNIKNEMRRLNINLLGISETRWTGMGFIKS